MKRLLLLLLIPGLCYAAPARYSWYTSGTVSADSTVPAEKALMDDTLSNMRVVAGMGGNGVQYMANNYPTVVVTRYGAHSWFQADSVSGGTSDRFYFRFAAAQFYTWDMMITLAEPDTQHISISGYSPSPWRFDGFSRMVNDTRSMVKIPGIVVANDGSTDYTEDLYDGGDTINVASGDTLYLRDYGPWHEFTFVTTTAGDTSGGGTLDVAYIDTAGDWTAVSANTHDSVLAALLATAGSNTVTMDPPPPLTGADAWGYMNDSALALRLIFSASWSTYPSIDTIRRFAYATLDTNSGNERVAFLGWEPLADTTSDGWADTGSYAKCEYYATPTSALALGRRVSGYFTLAADDSAGTLSARDSLGQKYLASMWGAYIDENSLPFDGITFNQPPVGGIFDDAGSQLSGSNALGYEGLSADSLQTISWAQNVQTALQFIHDTVDARTSARSDSSWINLTVSEVYGSSTKFTCYSANDWWRWGLRGRDYKNCAFDADDSTSRKSGADQLFMETWLKSFSTDNYYVSGGAGTRALDYLWQYVCADQRVIAMYEYTSGTSATVASKMGQSPGDTLVTSNKVFYWEDSVATADTIVFGSAGGSDSIWPGPNSDSSNHYALDNSASCFCSAVSKEGVDHYAVAVYWLMRPGSAYDSAYDDRFHMGVYTGVSGTQPECNTSGGDSRAGGWTDIWGPTVDLGEPVNGMDLNDSSYAAIATNYPYTVWDADSSIWSRQFVSGTDTNLVLWRTNMAHPGNEIYRYDSTGIDSFALGGYYKRITENVAGGLDTSAAVNYVKLFNDDGALLLAASSAARPIKGTSVSGVKISEKDDGYEDRKEYPADLGWPVSGRHARRVGR